MKRPYHFCPVCAGQLIQKKPQHNEVRRLVCARCGFIFYRNSKPTASVLITRSVGREVLLVKRAWPPRAGTWDVPGGFLELNEHPEAGARREIFEELAVRVHLTGFIGIYLDGYQVFRDGERRPIDLESTLNVLYEGAITTGRVRVHSDIAGARWFPKNHLPNTIAFPWIRRALEDWKKQKVLINRK